MSFLSFLLHLIRLDSMPIHICVYGRYNLQNIANNCKYSLRTEGIYQLFHHIASCSFHDKRTRKMLKESDYRGLQDADLDKILIHPTRCFLWPMHTNDQKENVEEEYVSVDNVINSHHLRYQIFSKIFDRSDFQVKGMKKAHTHQEDS